MGAGQTETSNRTEVQHHAETDGINLMQNESVLQNRRPGWAIWWKHLALGAIFLLVGITGGTETLPGGILLGGAFIGYAVLSRSQSRYIVTTERVKINLGLISSKTHEYRIPDIQSLATSQGMIERLLGYGTITVHTASNTRIEWRSVPGYEDVAQTIREEQRKYDQA